MTDNIISMYEKRCKEYADDPSRLNDYMMDAFPFLQEYYSITNSSRIQDEKFHLVFKINTEAQEIFKRYMIAVEGEPPEIERNMDNIICSNCDSELYMDNAITICYECGLTRHIVGEELTYKEEQEIEKNIVYSYKRENHFNEWISQFQGTESTTIPNEILNNLRYELQKERIKDLKEITHPKVRTLLKKLKLNKYYEHVPYIATILNGLVPPRMSNALEAKLRLMFSEIQAPFEKHCPKERKNFLSYSYVLYKFCELLGEDDFLPCFPLLKSKEKLKQQDIIWKNITQELQWEYIPTI